MAGVARRLRPPWMHGCDRQIDRHCRARTRASKAAVEIVNITRAEPMANSEQMASVSPEVPVG
jgi:hypothetical protein